MNRWWWLSGAIVSEVSATLALRAALDQPWFHLVVVSGYSAAFMFLSLTLRSGMPLGVAYGIWGAAGVGATALLSNVFFAEPITVLMALGMVLVIAGVLVVESSGGREPDSRRQP